MPARRPRRHTPRSRRRVRPQKPAPLTTAVINALDNLYAGLPTVECKGLCQHSCASIGMAPVEQQRIQEQHRITIPLMGYFAGEDGTGRCPALNTRTGRCDVYTDRPLVCRIWGVEETMLCEHGCTPEPGIVPRSAGPHLLSELHRIDIERGRL